MEIKKYLKIIGFLLFIYILYKVNLKELFSVFRNINFLYFFSSLFFWFSVIFLRIFKWKVLVDFLEKKLSFKELSLAFNKGLFLGIITPGRLGEFYRTQYLKEKTNISLGSSFWTVTLDKIVDFQSTALLSLMAVFYLVFGLKLKILAVIIPFLLLFIILSFYLLFSKNQTKPLLKFVLKFFLPSNLKEKTENFTEDFFKMMKEVKLSLFLKLLSFDLIGFLIITLAHYLLALALGLTAPFWYLFLIVPLVAMIIFIPVSIQGIGTREVSYVYLLSFFSIDPSQALAFSLLSFFCGIIIGIPGLILYLKK